MYPSVCLRWRLLKTGDDFAADGLHLFLGEGFAAGQAQGAGKDAFGGAVRCGGAAVFIDGAIGDIDMRFKADEVRFVDISDTVYAQADNIGVESAMNNEFSSSDFA